LDEFQNLLLTGCELDVVHGGSCTMLGVQKNIQTSCLDIQ